MDLTDAQLAATQACRRLGVGEPSLIRHSSAAAFLAPGAFLRVVREGDDPWGTLSIAHLVATSAHGALPLEMEPLRVEFPAEPLYVETYQRLHPLSGNLVDFATLGRRLAELHGLPIGSLHEDSLHEANPHNIRHMRRINASRLRLARASSEIQDLLAPLLDELEEQIGQITSPLVLCHGDPNRDNLVHTDQGPVWVDFEYAGLAPAAHDVSYCITTICRFLGHQQAREFLQGYQEVRAIDAFDIVLLDRVRELYGVVDYCYQTDAAHQEEFMRRLASFQEPFRRTPWQTLTPKHH